MTQLLEKVLIEVFKLPPEKQDFIATVILEELEDERKWDKALLNHKINSLKKCVLILRQVA